MKKCDHCGKPLTEFETAFHREAASPPAISGKCWRCSGAEMQFMDGRVDKPHHRLEILLCLVGVALIVALFLPLRPYLTEESLPAHLALYPYLLLLAYFAIGTLITVVIRRRGGKKPKLQEWDPPMNRFTHTYGPNTDIYTTTVNRDGDLVTTKETRLGGSINDNWSAHASSGSSLIDGISKFYGKLLYLCLVPCIYMLLGGTFIIWAIPYVLVMLAGDSGTKKQNKAVPHALAQAYRHCRATYPAPLSYDDKAGYLVSREQHRTKKSEARNSFLAHYQPKADTDDLPFFYTRRDGVSYMIVEYKREQGKNYGTTFLLMEAGDGRLQKRIAVGDGLLPTDPSSWKHEWYDAGVSQQTMNHLERYEQKMNEILHSPKKNSTFMG